MCRFCVAGACCCWLSWFGGLGVASNRAWNLLHECRLCGLEELHFFGSTKSALMVQPFPKAPRPAAVGCLVLEGSLLFVQDVVSNTPPRLAGPSQLASQAGWLADCPGHAPRWGGQGWPVGTGQLAAGCTMLVQGVTLVSSTGPPLLCACCVACLQLYSTLKISVNSGAVWQLTPAGSTVTAQRELNTLNKLAGIKILPYLLNPAAAAAAAAQQGADAQQQQQQQPAEPALPAEVADSYFKQHLTSTFDQPQVDAILKCAAHVQLREAGSSGGGGGSRGSNDGSSGSSGGGWGAGGWRQQQQQWSAAARRGSGVIQCR